MVLPLLKYNLIIILFLILLYFHNHLVSIDADKFIIDNNLKLELVVEGLNQPISMAFINDNEILVLEKKGIVQRIVNNTISPVTPLNITHIVNSQYERGLLGITVSQENSDNEIKDKKYPDVYLFYTENVSNTSTGNSFCILVKCHNNNDVVNSLYKYRFQDGKLIDPELLLRLPTNGNSSNIHVGGIITMGPDNKIYITSGDGNACSNIKKCKFLFNNGSLNSQTANRNEGTTPSGHGGILYFDTKSGDINNYNSILGNKYPLNLYYAYGIRNSFGIDFDPVTGNLWDTENGPTFGDEINLVEPGFNSGWAKKQGMWPIVAYNQLTPDPLPGETRGYNFSKIQNLENDIDNDEIFVDFDGKGKYSDPEFTWNFPVGVTAIKFFNSEAYGKKYKNDIFVGTFNDGKIFNFNLDADRKNLDLKGKLKDKIADKDEELLDVIFARKLSSITDLETGPDGYLYVLSIGKGKIWRIVPTLSPN